MSDEGEKTCPLCAEEMDLTDQQLKPCRCGYEVCVWCWHHIMEIAEKDETEGKCPACRTPYDKEKIVGTAANCERLAAGGGTEKKHKSQKTKSKTSESRKPLTSVRVIQRNLVYLVGLPFNLADDDASSHLMSHFVRHLSIQFSAQFCSSLRFLHFGYSLWLYHFFNEQLLQQKEYFGKYGKVLKVSISRNSTGSIQQFANNTFSVYITYAREDEAIRCIQSVHMFILDGRPLRACFGTTKYCHAWLRNAPCNNPDCLYFHEIGTQEDSFTKDDIVSAYSRVQQITGITNNMQQGSGDVLPPPTDNYCNNISTVPRSHEIKSSINNSVSSTRGSLPSSSSGLPPSASWGAHGANGNPATGNTGSSNASIKEKPETTNGLPVIPSIVSSSPQTSKLRNNTGKRHVIDEETHAKLTNSKMKASATAKQHPGSNSKSTIQTPRSVTIDYHKTEDSTPLNTKCSTDERPCSPSKHKEETFAADVNIEKLSAGISIIGIDKQPSGEYSEVFRPGGLTLDNFISHIDDSLQWDESGRNEEQSGAREMCDLTSEVQALSKHNLTSETVDDFDNQRLRDAIVSQARMPTSSPLHMLSNLRIPLQPQADSDFTSSYMNPPSLYKGPCENVSINPPMGSVSSNGFLEHLMNHAFGQGNSLVNGTQANYMGQFGNELTHVESRPALDVGENHIISNDSWGDPFTSQNLAKFFGENNKQESSSNLANSWTSQGSNHSRFSFARQEDSRNHLFDSRPSMGNNSYTANNTSFGQGFLENRDPYQDNRLNGPEFHHHRNMEFSNNFLGGSSGLSSSKLPVSRSQISAPPGFTAPSRPPPPGFTSHESLDFLKSGNKLHETSLHLGNPYQASHSGNINTANDIEFIDPAIMAVGKGRPPTGFNNSSNDMRSSFHVQAPGFENEFRLQSLMQRSHPSHQIPTYNNVRQFSPPNNAYNFPSQSNNASHLSNFSLQEPRNTVVSNGQWDGWSEFQSTNDMNMGERLRNDRTGLANFYGGYEDSKFQMMNSSDLYNKSFGM